MLSGCSSRAEQTRKAYETYQAALATGSLPYIRTSLLALVAADEDNPEYWAELGKVQLQLGAPSEAYYSFVRAHELDRSNVGILQVLTQLALRGGNLDRAEEHADQLSILAPEDPTVKMTQAYVALRRGNTDEADQIADSLLVERPYDAGVKALKARVLLKTEHGDEAVRLLEDQVRQQPTDLISLGALIGILDRQDNWEKVAQYGSRYTDLSPEDVLAGIVTTNAALRSGDIPTARRVTLRTLSPKLQPSVIASVLDPWLLYGPKGGFVAEAARLGAAAEPAQKIVYATYLNKAGAPDAAARLVAGAAQLPVTATNEDAHAVLGTSLSLRGQSGPALERFDEVLSLDPNHAGALEGRARLLLRAGKGRRARLDAQRLATVTPNAPEAHILLAEVYSALGDRQQAGRVLWNAFHQISADRNIYEALRVFVSKSGDPDAARRLDQEFGDQRNAKLTREFI